MVSPPPKIDSRKCPPAEVEPWPEEAFEPQSSGISLTRTSIAPNERT
jgi:hypothetical protein